jgi:hypothetical protein
VNAHLAIRLLTAIIAPPMTSKSLVLIVLRPLTGTLFWLVLILNPLLLPSLTRAQLLEMTDLIAHPQHYDRKEVVVMGQVSNVQPVKDREGRSAFQFFLKDAFGTLKVISRTQVEEGDQVIVEGTFTRRRQSGRITVYNEVNATSVRPLNQFDPDLVG